MGNLSGVPGQLHYWLQLSEGNPSTDPVILWLNGGPGASGIIGMLTELGQLQTIPAPGHCPGTATGDGTATPTLYQNPFAWTKVANLFTIEQPKGVGFSYCTGSGPCINTDESTAQDTYEALVAFFAAFPEYAKNDFFITGESYAGVYVPMIVDQIDTQGGLPNFKGAAIGNGCWGSDCFYGVTESEIDFHTFRGQAMMSPTLAAQIETACDGEWLNVTAAEGTCGGMFSQGACPKLLREMCTQVGNDEFNVYNMYDTCFPSNEASSPHRSSLAAVRAKLRESRPVEVRSVADSLRSHPALHAPGATAPLRPATSSSGSFGQLNDYSCGGETEMSKWLDDKSVQEALHVKANGGGMRYHQTCGDLRPLYAKLIPRYKFLIYSGNVDACVPTWGSEQWTRDLGYSIDKDWHPWTSDSASPGSSSNVLAGYSITYATNGFTFATVRGAGHEVPRYKPDFALTMVKKFVKGDPL